MKGLKEDTISNAEEQKEISQKDFKYCSRHTTPITSSLAFELILTLERKHISSISLSSGEDAIFGNLTDD